MLYQSEILGVGDEVRLSSSCGRREDLIAHVLNGIADGTVDAAIAELVPGQQVAVGVHGVPIIGTLDISPANLDKLPQDDLGPNQQSYLRASQIRGYHRSYARHCRRY